MMAAMTFFDAKDKAARVGKGWLEHGCNVGNGFAGIAKGVKVCTEEFRRGIICWIIVLLVCGDGRWFVAPGRNGAIRGAAVTISGAWSTAASATTIRVTARITVTGSWRSW